MPVAPLLAEVIATVLALRGTSENEIPGVVDSQRLAICGARQTDPFVGGYRTRLSGRFVGGPSHVPLEDEGGAIRPGQSRWYLAG